MSGTPLRRRNARPHVLIVDDEKLLLSALSRILGGLPINLHLANSPEAGLKVLSSVPVDVVISDYRMPGMGGGQFLRQVHAGWPKTVRILMTAYANGQETRRTIEEANVHRLITKPCSPDEMCEAVAEALSHRERSIQRSDEVPGLKRRGLPHDVFRQVFHSAPDPAVLADQDGNVLKFNHAFVQRAGGSYRTALERGTVLDGWEASWPEIQQALRASGQWQGELRHATEERHSLFTITGIRDKGGDLCGMSVVEKDITAYRRLEQASRETRYNIPLALARIAEFRDCDTGAHLLSIRSLSWILAVELARMPQYATTIDEDFLDALYGASPLHDVGKVAIPDAVLLKPGPLDEQEWQVMRTHCEIGAEFFALAGAGSVPEQWMEIGRYIALQHHEKWDGSGYPAGLKGEEIHLSARIVALADAYDAITSKRVYKEAMSHEEARRRIVEDSGTHFDPDVVEVFLQVENALCEAKQRALTGNFIALGGTSAPFLERGVEEEPVEPEEDDGGRAFPGMAVVQAR